MIHMEYNPEIHHRTSIRLKGYDYSSDGAYFVTICTYQRECLFGEIVDGKMLLNEYGKIIASKWEQSSTIRQEIELDEWIVMPNHFHGIIFITNQPSVGANGCSPLQMVVRPHTAVRPHTPIRPHPALRQSPKNPTKVYRHP
ncbi:MAG: hypothetical protein PUP93_20655 [Rhizonema sp. NSF051]|nr:hypothetical protein [Rhizonema sp. NSF051]